MAFIRFIPRKVRPNRISNRRIKQNEIYYPTREEFLSSGNGKCQLNTPDCTLGIATCVHHTEGRIGDDLLDFSKCLRSCHPCNSWVEQHPEEAKKLGLKKPNYKSKLSGVGKL